MMRARNERKVLLMGRSGSGKTSMRSIIFANYLARQTGRLGPTLGIENSHVRFLGSLSVAIWDCGGQDAFMENYFESQRSLIFRNVHVLIYVFDVESSEREKDLADFRSCLDAMVQQNSKGAQIFVLFHKMDLIARAEDRVRMFRERTAELEKLAAPLKLQCYRSSIWDESLYKAWSAIVHALVPNVARLEKQLAKFADVCDAAEAVVFESATFLVLCSTTRVENADRHRHEKISNIVKQFKLACQKTDSQFRSMQVKNKNFTAFVEKFTESTFILVVMTNKDIRPAATLMNIKVASQHFEKFVKTNAKE